MTIKELRKLTGLNQEQFALKYHLSIVQVQSWEQGRRKPSKGMLYLLERCVGEDFCKDDK